MPLSGTLGTTFTRSNKFSLKNIDSQNVHSNHGKSRRQEPLDCLSGWLSLSILVVKDVVSTIQSQSNPCLNTVIHDGTILVPPETRSIKDIQYTTRKLQHLRRPLLEE